LAGDLILSTEGSGGGGNILVAMRADGSGEEAFRITKAAPYVPTPVVQGDLAFLWADNGIVTCIELPSGKVVWTQRVGGNVSSSPIIVAGRLVGISDDGVVTVLSASRGPQVLGRVELNALVRATPAADEDHLLIRTASKLVCIGSSK
jgi:outer membrane protein assembly factor BamB